MFAERAHLPLVQQRSGCRKDKQEILCPCRPAPRFKILIILIPLKRHSDFYHQRYVRPLPSTSHPPSLPLQSSRGTQLLLAHPVCANEEDLLAMERLQTPEPGVLTRASSEKTDEVGFRQGRNRRAEASQRWRCVKLKIS